jgi:mono/diheme cytochrome c family protein
MTFTGDSLWPQAHAVVTFDATPGEGATHWRMQDHAATGTLTAVAFDGQGQWVAQSREPALLSFEDGTTLELDSASAANTGLDLFYVNTGGGLSCAGCHPEGDEDGRTWAFPQGLRRTQTLGGGVMSREPFHWDGEMPEIRTLVDEVMLSRMSFETDVSPEQVQILGRWMDTIPAAPSLTREGTTGALRDPSAIERGRALFSDPVVACNSCHSGESFTDNKPYDVGTGGTFFTPTLLGIALRDSFMHDGCAATLEQRFGICGGGDTHGKTSHLTRSQIDDLVAYMGTL